MFKAGSSARGKMRAPAFPAVPEDVRINVIRGAAGVVGIIGQRTPLGRHFGRFVCVDCPRESHVPPYLPFGLNIHQREHLERHPGHQIIFYCFDHCEFEDDRDLPGRPPQPWDLPQPEGEGANVPQVPTVVMQALEVLTAAGYDVTPPESLHEPPPLVVTHAEAEVLKLVRANPGITSRSIAEIRGVTISTITTLLHLLQAGRLVRKERARVQGGIFGWFAVGDRRIGNVPARCKVRWSPRPIATIRPPVAALLAAPRLGSESAPVRAMFRH